MNIKIKQNNIDLFTLDENKELPVAFIVDPKPIKFTIGKKFVLVRELPIKQMKKVWNSLILVISKYSELSNLEILLKPELKSNEELIDHYIKLGSQIYKSIILNKQIKKAIDKLIVTAIPDLGKYGQASKRYILKHITPTQAVAIILSIYRLNYAEVKKKILSLTREIFKMDTPVM